jgi:predicted ArsR family transcriptional regulator
MPRGVTRTVLSRAEEMHKLLLSEGCITVERARRALGTSRTQARYVLSKLQTEGRAVSAAVGRATLWCRDGEAAAQALEELAGEARRLLCGFRFATPSKLLKLISRDKKASRTFSKYIPLSPRVAAAVSFLNALLQLIFSQPAMYSGATPVYLVPPCQGVKFKSWK